MDFGKSRKWDVSNLYKNKPQDTKNIIEYVRDENGFRSFEKNPSKKIVFTIGGSTTAQKAVTEKRLARPIRSLLLGMTSSMEVYGFTSYAHLISLNN